MLSETELKDWKKSNKIPSWVGKPGNITEEGYVKMQLQKDDYDLSLKELKDILKKWLELPDTKLLACYIATEANDNPLWIFIKGSSSCGKSTLLEALTGLEKIRRVDVLTKNTLASGKLNKKGKAVKDLGEELQGKRTLLIFPDLACMKTLNSDEKKAIFGQLRNLYDGFIQKDTGNGISKNYDDCHVCLLAGTTPDVEKEFSLANQLGTRQLTYKVYFPKSSRRKAKELVVENMGKKKERDREIKDAMHRFLRCHRFKETTIPKEIKEFCFEKVDEIASMRATANFESRTGRLSSEVSEEEGFRALSQLLLLYQALKSVDKNYKSENFKKIVNNIVKNSANSNRYRIYKLLKEHPDKEFTMNALKKKLILGRREITRECFVLHALGIINLKEEFNTDSLKTENIIVSFKGGHNRHDN